MMWTRAPGSDRVAVLDVVRAAHNAACHSVIKAAAPIPRPNLPRAFTLVWRSPIGRLLPADRRSGVAMVKAVFTHKAGSIYDDLPEERYHFPETYLRQAEATIGDFIIYYEPGRVGTQDRGRYGRRAYVAVAEVTGVRPDPARGGHFYADITNYMSFDRPVPFREGDHYYERQLQRPDGGTSKGAFGRALRPISEEDFAEILAAGFAEELRQEEMRAVDLTSVTVPHKLMEDPSGFERPIIERILSRPFRDEAFRHAVQAVYDFDLRYDWY